VNRLDRFARPLRCQPLGFAPQHEGDWAVALIKLGVGA
jgi:hypothetical protein